jgi:hypothetical protein
LSPCHYPHFTLHLALPILIRFYPWNRESSERVWESERSEMASLCVSSSVTFSSFASSSHKNEKNIIKNSFFGFSYGLSKPSIQTWTSLSWLQTTISVLILSHVQVLVLGCESGGNFGVLTKIVLCIFELRVLSFYLSSFGTQAKILPHHSLSLSLSLSLCLTSTFCWLGKCGSWKEIYILSPIMDPYGHTIQARNLNLKELYGFYFVETKTITILWF